MWGNIVCKVATWSAWEPGVGWAGSPPSRVAIGCCLFFGVEIERRSAPTVTLLRSARVLLALARLERACSCVALALVDKDLVAC